MAEHSWKSRRERSNTFMLRTIIAIALWFGRPVARLVLVPITVYFLFTAGPVRRSASDFLERALQRPAGWLEVGRNIFYFAATILDRVFLLTGREQLDVHVHGLEAIDQLSSVGQGALLVISHLGSFEILRAASMTRADGLRIKVLMNLEHGRKMNEALFALNPGFADSIIDTANADVNLVMRVRDSVAAGEMVGIMADRLNDSRERSVDCRFFGDSARFPAAPWQLAAALPAPVVLCIGLYRGGSRYDLFFERMTPGETVPRAERQAWVTRQARKYAERLEHYARLSPYNWFNFFDFWEG